MSDEKDNGATEKIVSVEEAIIQINSMLKEYMSIHGMQLKGVQFSCPNKNAHRNGDKHMSAGLFNIKGQTMWKCQACDAGIDTIAMAAIVENLPLRGADFATRTVTHLAKELGIGTVKIDKNPLVDIYDKISDHIKPMKDFRDIPEDIQKEYKIGTLSYVAARNLASTMVGAKGSGFSKEERNTLNEVMKRVFDERVLFTISNKIGHAIGFAGRIYKDKDERRKWENGPTTPVFKKSSVLYLYDRAHRYAMEADKMYLVEGYIDAIRMHMHGLKNTVAVLFNKITPVQAHIIKSSKVNRIVLALDTDPDTSKTKSKAFESGVILNNLELDVYVKKIPDVGHDPDSYILEHGIEKFNAIPEIPLIEYAMGEIITEKDNQKQIKTYMRWIAKHYKSMMTIEKAVRGLSAYTGFSTDMLMDDMHDIINDIREREDSMLIGEKNEVAQDLMRASSTEVPGILREALNKFNKKVGAKLVTPVKQVEEITILTQRMNEGFSLINLGFNGLEDLIKVPRNRGTFNVIAAHPNVGKSSFLRNLCHNIIHVNTDVTVIYYTMDDDKEDVVSALASLSSKAPLEVIRYVAGVPEQIKAAFMTEVTKGLDNVVRYISDERLVLIDGTDSANAYALEGIVKSVKRRTGNHVVLMIDSIHSLIDQSIGSIKDPRVTAMVVASEIEKLSNETKSSVFAIAEFNRTNRNVEKPTLANISESVKLEYLAKVGMTLHSDMMTASDSVWTWINTEAQLLKNISLPILELVIEKNKTGYKKGSLYYRFDPEHSHFSELTSNEVEEYRQRERDNRRRR